MRAPTWSSQIEFALSSYILKIYNKNVSRGSSIYSMGFIFIHLLSNCFTNDSKIYYDYNMFQIYSSNVVCGIPLFAYSTLEDDLIH